MPKRPVIGITAFETHYPEPPHAPLFALNRRYVAAIEAAGGAPLIVPPGLGPAALDTIFARLDGLLLSGGGDVDPIHYGEAPHPALTSVSADRDDIEMALTRRAVEADTPLLAVCRGIQVLNVALGGSLVQDIPTQRPGSLEHMPDRAKVARHHNTQLPDRRFVIGVQWHPEWLTNRQPEMRRLFEALVQAAQQ
jgi:putative glutamine amidotransferase